MYHLVERQVELLVEQLEAGERAGHQARAVIAAPARDDLLLLRPAEDVVVVPDELDVGLVGVRAREAEVDLAHAPSVPPGRTVDDHLGRSEEHTSELQSLMRISYAVFCLKKKKKQ